MTKDEALEQARELLQGCKLASEHGKTLHEARKTGDPVTLYDRTVDFLFAMQDGYED